MTTDDEILRGLKGAAREKRVQDQTDPRLEALINGTLSPDEEAELNALAARSPEIKESLELYRPLDQEFRQRMVARIQAELRGTADLEQEQVAEEKLIPIKARRRVSKTIFTLVPLAAAAVLLAFLLIPAGQGSKLPSYSLTIEGGLQSVRGPVDPSPSLKIPRYGPGTRFTITLRPEHASAQPVGARVFVERSAKMQQLEIPIEVDPQGAIRISGIVGRDLTLPAGQWTVWIALSRPAELPEIEQMTELKTSAKAREAANTIVLSSPIYIQD